jgi:3-phenylpropionate/trans-cinnamate dioxygenase ferredoxin subunit
MTSKTFARALKESDLPAGGRQVVEIAGKAVLLLNTGGKIHAVSNICSHANEKLECGRASASWIACPVHGARFDLATGAAKNPPATRPIAVYAVRVVDEWIEVRV